MLKRVASFFSVLFHPLFFPTYSMLLVHWVAPQQLAGWEGKARLILFGGIIVNTVLFPLLTIFLMQKLEMIKSIYLRKREERIIPLVAIATFYFWAFMVIKNLDVSPFITVLFLGASISVFGSFFFNLFFKISLHTVGAGAFIGIALLLTFISSYNLEIPLLVIIIFAGLVGSARWYLDEHNGLEIFSGYAVGFISQLIAFKVIG